VSAQQSDKTPDVVVHGSARSFRQEIVVGKHGLVGDEPVSAGGGDAGPDPYDYLLTALGVCTSMTVGLYARRKQLPLENITVSLRTRAFMQKIARNAKRRRACWIGLTSNWT
jgi:putative redox protein